MAGREDGVEPLRTDPGAGDHSSDFLLFNDFPVDKLFDIGVIQVQAHHLGRAPRCPAGLDRARRAVSDSEERHQPGGLASARERFVLAPQLGEVRSRARAVFEDPCFASPQIHDPAIIDQVILN